MSASLIDEIQRLSVEMVNASAIDDEATINRLYDELTSLCMKHEGGEFDHPLQWEALGDFSDNHDERIIAYKKGLLCAQQLNFPDYAASIKFAIAESYHEEGSVDEALRWAVDAQAELGDSSCELSFAIAEFITVIES